MDLVYPHNRTDRPISDTHFRYRRPRSPLLPHRRYRPTDLGHQLVIPSDQSRIPLSDTNRPTDLGYAFPIPPARSPLLPHRRYRQTDLGYAFPIPSDRSRPRSTVTGYPDTGFTPSLIHDQAGHGFTPRYRLSRLPKPPKGLTRPHEWSIKPVYTDKATLDGC